MCDAAMAPAMIESHLASTTSWSNGAESASPSSPPTTPSLSAAALEHRQRRRCALNFFCAKPTSASTSLQQHDYFDCSMKVHYSSLLDHWLGCHCTCKASSSPESSRSSSLLDALSALSDNASDTCILNVLHSSPITSESGCEEPRSHPNLLRLVLENNERFSDALLTRLVVVLSSSMDLSLLRHLLPHRRYALASSLADTLLSSSPSPSVLANSAASEDDRTLLTHAVTHGDRSLALTRVLLRHGARVWPVRSPSSPASASPPPSPPPSPVSTSVVVAQVHAERRHSAFVWLLKALMNDLRLEESSSTLHLLGELMSEQPSRMRQHVTRSMLALGRGASVNGPLFLRVHLQLTHYWSEPPTLRQLCLRRLRHSLGPKRLNQGPIIARLQLPGRLGRMLRLEESSSGRRLSSGRRRVHQ